VEPLINWIEIPVKNKKRAVKFYSSRVVPAGGRVVLEKTFLADEAGYLGMFFDTEGNKIGLQSPK
jgi:predicted enzyme related to lactoylglutathione lyase